MSPPLITRPRLLLLRGLTALLSALLWAAGVGALMLALALMESGRWSFGGFTLGFEAAPLDHASRAVWLVVAVAALAAGSMTLYVALWRPARALMIELSTRPNRALYRGARVAVSERAMLAMLAYAAEQVAGVREAMPTISLARSGWRVRCDVAIWTGASLHDCSAQIEAALREALTQHTGIPVQSVSLAIHDLPIGAQARRLTMEVPDGAE